MYDFTPTHIKAYLSMQLLDTFKHEFLSRKYNELCLIVLECIIFLIYAIHTNHLPIFGTKTANSYQTLAFLNFLYFGLYPFWVILVSGLLVSVTFWDQFHKPRSLDGVNMMPGIWIKCGRSQMLIMHTAKYLVTFGSTQ